MSIQEAHAALIGCYIRLGADVSGIFFKGDLALVECLTIDEEGNQHYHLTAEDGLGFIEEVEVDHPAILQCQMVTGNAH